MLLNKDVPPAFVLVDESPPPEYQNDNPEYPKDQPPLQSVQLNITAKIETSDWSNDVIKFLENIKGPEQRD